MLNRSRVPSIRFRGFRQIQVQVQKIHNIRGRQRSTDPTIQIQTSKYPNPGSGQTDRPERSENSLYRCGQRQRAESHPDRVIHRRKQMLDSHFLGRFVDLLIKGGEQVNVLETDY